MGWQRDRGLTGALALTVCWLAAATLLGGCFQPLYGDHSLAGGSGVHRALAGIDVGRVAVRPSSPDTFIAAQIRNDLIFNFTGGGSPGTATHRLQVQIAGSPSTVSSSTVGIPVIENYVLNATYSLTEVRTNRVVLTGRAIATAPYDPSGTQRFARITGMQDAERRAAKVIADNITTRMAAYFYSGG